MDDSSKTTTGHRSDPKRRLVTQRPPIQWPVRSEVTHSTKAASLAREKVERTYAQEGEPHQPKPVNTPSEVQENAASTPTQAAAEQVAHPHRPQTMREQPYDWGSYHTAWQQYYHQYFYRYYAGWWLQQKQQIESQAHLQAVEKAKQEVAATVPENQKVASELRQKIRATVSNQSKKVKSSIHFKPALAALTVGISFLLLNYNQVLVGAIKQYVAPGSVVTTPVIVEPNAQASVGPNPKIIIPKIGVDVPVVFDEPKVDEASYQKALERGVVRLGTTADPGTKGNVVIGGHSSNNVFNAGKYKYAFVNLKKLDVGDILYVNFNGVRYTYKVTVAKKIITPKDTSVLSQTEKPTVTLFTCDPPGTNINRLIVQAEQIDPSPDAAANNTNQPTAANPTNPLPSVAPSLWNRLFHF